MNPHSPQQIDWPGIRTLAVTIGVREAARQVGRDLPPDEQNRFIERVLKRSTRERWIAQKKEQIAEVKQRRPNLTGPTPKALSSNVHLSSNGLANVLGEASERVKRALGTACVKASEHVSELNPAIILARAQEMRQVALTAGQVFSWEDRSQSGVNLQLNVAIGGMNQD
jgi:hypothetical protein